MGDYDDAEEIQDAGNQPPADHTMRLQHDSRQDQTRATNGGAARPIADSGAKKNEAPVDKIELTENSHQYISPANNFLRKKIDEIMADERKSLVLQHRLMSESVEKQLALALDQIGPKKIPGYAQLIDKEKKEEKDKLGEPKLDLLLDLIAREEIPEYAACNNLAKAQIRNSLRENHVDLLLDLIAKETIPGYQGFDQAHQAQARQKLHEGMKKSANTEFEQLKKDVGGEINADKFGGASRKVYAAYVDQINEEATIATKTLIEKKMPLLPHCPIKVPVDEHGISYNSDQVRQAIASGELAVELPDYAHGEKDPGFAQVIELTLAESFLKDAHEKLSPKSVAGIREQARQYENMFKWIFEGNPPPGWMSDISKFNDSQVNEYCENAAPWLEVLIQVNDHVRAVQALEQAPGDLDTAVLAQSIKEGFPGTIEVKNGKIVITPDRPATLDSSQLSINQRRLLSAWVKRARDPIDRAINEYKFAGEGENKDKICHWGDKPADRLPGTEIALHDGQQYDYKHCRYTAKEVSVEILQPNGVKSTEQRIKVTTSTEYMRSGLFDDYSVGKPVLSGYATANGEKLDDTDQLLGLTSRGKILSMNGAGNTTREAKFKGICAQLRLSDKGTVQVRALDNANGTAVLTDSEGKAAELKPTASNDGWVDVLPGYKLAVGRNPTDLHKIDLQNNGIRYYRMNEVVAVDDGHKKPVRAAALPGEVALKEGLENLSEFASKAMDIGFIMMGGPEGVAYSAARRELTKAALTRGTSGIFKSLAEREAGALVKTALEREATRAARGMGDAALKQSLDALWVARNKHLLLGGLGLLKHQTKYLGNKAGATIGVPTLGDMADSARGLFMGTDVFASATAKAPGIGKLSQAWLSKLGHADPELMTKYLGQASILNELRLWNEKVLTGIDPYYSVDAVLGMGDEINKFRRTIEKIDEQERRVFQQITDRLGNYGGGQSVVSQFATSLSKKDREQITSKLAEVVENIESGQTTTEKEIVQLAATILDDQALQENKIAAAMSLLILRQRQDGSTPEVLAAFTADDKSQRKVELADVERLIMNYSPVRFSQSHGKNIADNFTRCTNGLANEITAEDRDLLIEGTGKSLASPDDSVERQSQVRKLVGVYNDNEKAQSSRLAAGLGLLFLGSDKDGAIKQGLGERKGWAVSVNVSAPTGDGKSVKVGTRNVFEEDKKRAIEIAADILPKPVNQSYGHSAEPIREVAVLSDVLEQLRGQLASIESKKGQKGKRDQDQPHQYTYSPQARLAIADLLYQVGQMDREEHGIVCLEALTDAKAGRAQKCATFFDDRQERFAQLLTYYQDQGNAARAEAAVERVLSSPGQDADVRAIAAIMLDISRIENVERRQVQLNDLRDTWKEFQKQSTRSTKGQSTLAANQRDKTFGHVYADRLLKSLADTKSDRQERFHTAYRLDRLSKNGVVELDKNERRQMNAVFMETLQFVSGKSAGPFLERTVLDVDNAAKEMSVGAMRALADHVDTLKDTDQINTLRANLVSVLNLPNPTRLLQGKSVILDPDEKINSLGETLLKQAVVGNAKFVFAEANEKEIKQLADALKKNIVELASPYVSANEEDGLISGGNGQETQQKIIEKKQQLVEQSITALTQLSLSRTAADSKEMPAIKADTISLLAELASNKCPAASGSVEAHVRLTALKALNEMRSLNAAAEDRVTSLCAALLTSEKDPAILEEVEALHRLSAQKDQDSFYAEYLQAKKEIKEPEKQLDLSKADAYIAGHFSESLLDTHAKTSTGRRVASELSEGEKVYSLRASAHSLRFEISNAVDRVLNNGDQAEAARLALFKVLKIGDPIIAPYREKARELAAEGWKRIAEEGSLEVKKAIAPLTALLMADTTMMPYKGRNDILSSWVTLARTVNTSSGQPVPLLTKQQVATPICMDLESEFRRCPRDISDPNFKNSQDFQMAELKALGPFLTDRTIPLLVAIADDEYKSDVKKDANGLRSEVSYADGRKLSVTRENGQIASFAFLPKTGKGDEWIKDSASGNFFAKSDLKKEHPWHCTAELLENGAFVIKDSPDRFLGNLYAEDLAEGKGTGKSPGGTVTTKYGTETIYTKDGAKVFVAPLGPSYSWAQVAYPDGSSRSQGFETSGKTSGAPIFRPAYASAQNSNALVRAQADDPLRSPPAWLAGLTSNEDFYSFDRDSYSFRRLDACNNAAYETRIQTDGSVIVNERGHLSGSILSEPLQVKTVVSAPGQDDVSDHPMPLVRQAARSLLARQAEDTESMREEVQAASISNATDPEQSAKTLRAVLDNPQSSEQVCKAIFTAGLALPIKDEADPRRDLLQKLLTNPNERIRLSAAQILAEQSTIIADRQVAALELAHLAEQGSLLGYREGAQRTIQFLKEQVAKDTDPSTSVIRLALDLYMPAGPIKPEDYRTLLSDRRPIIRLKAANNLLAYGSADDKQAAARVICQLAKGSDSVEMRDKAMALIRHTQNSNRLREALGRNHHDKQLLQETLAATAQQPLPTNSGPSQARLANESHTFKDRYQSIKLAIGASKVNYLDEFRPELLTENDKYKLLDVTQFDKYTKDNAYNKQSWGWWALRYAPDYAAESKSSHADRRLQMLALQGAAMADSRLTNSDDSLVQQQRKQTAHQARIILAHLALAERGEIGDQAIKAVAAICEGTGADAYQMTEIVVNRFLCDPSLSSRNRQTLFSAVERHGVNSQNLAFEARLAQAAAQILELEYQTMPRDSESQQFHDSENFQVKLLGYWQKNHYKDNIATALALRSSPSPLVVKAAYQLLQSLDVDKKYWPVIPIPREPSAKPATGKKNLTATQVKGNRSGQVIDLEKNRYLPDVTVG